MHRCQLPGRPLVSNLAGLPPECGIDPVNRLLDNGPHELRAAIMEAASGRIAVITLRTPSTTLTVLLSPAEAQDWADHLTAVATKVSSSIIQAGNGRARSGLPEL